MHQFACFKHILAFLLSFGENCSRGNITDRDKATAAVHGLIFRRVADDSAEVACDATRRDSSCLEPASSYRHVTMCPV